MESVTESVLSAALGLLYKHESFTINDIDRVCARVCLWQDFKPIMSSNDGAYVFMTVCAVSSSFSLF